MFRKSWFVHGVRWLLPLTLLLALSGELAAAKKVVLQLPWKHQFQFAGYYAAAAQGYYQQAGLSVDIREASPGHDPVQEVLTGKAQYGVGRSELVLHYLQGKAITVLAPVFQHSAVIFLTKKSSGISTPQDLAGRRVMLLDGSSAAEYLAVLKSEGLRTDQIIRQPSSLDIMDLVNDRTDVFNAYSSNEPFFLQQLGIPYSIIYPRHYGIDFYGDSLYTSHQEIHDHPERVAAFREASLRGWQYACDHPEEIINLLQKQYGVTKSREHLQFEASNLVELIQADLVAPGHSNPGRWLKMAQTFIDLGLAEKMRPLEPFLYDPAHATDYRPLIAKIMAGTAALCIAYALLMLFIFNRRLKRQLALRSAELRQSESLFREVLNTMSSGVAIYQAADDGQSFYFKEMNPAGLRISSMRREEILGREVREVFPLVIPMGLFPALQRVWRSGQPERIPDYCYLLPDRSFWIANSLCRLPSGEVAAIFDDISERKNAEEQLLRSQQAWEQTFEAMGEIVTLLDCDYRIIRANKAAGAVLGVPPHELIGKKCHELFNDDSAPCTVCPALALQQGDSGKWTTIHHRKLGKIFNVSAAAVRDTSGAIQFIVHVAQDITEQRRLEDDLAQASKMEAIGTLAGGIAHDFNNILAVIMGEAELARCQADDGELLQELDSIIHSAERGANLVRQILTFSRKSDREKSLLMPAREIQETLRLLRATAPASIAVSADLAEDCGPVLVSPVALQQIILNLCTNALQAMESGSGQLQVRLHRGQPDSGPDSSGAPPPPCAVIEISDTGSGMDAITLARVFEPYFTTKDIGKGTGLGLAIVHGIVSECQGTIRVTSTPGKGSTFSVFLPLASEIQPDRAPPQELAGPAQHLGTKHILLVDDEPLLLRINEKRLRSRGYQVTAFQDSQAALAAFTSDPQLFHLLITDQNMPGLTGAELAEAILHGKPSLPVIMCTGHSDLVPAEKALEMGIRRYVLKPLRENELLRLVEELLRDEEKVA